MKNIAVFCDGTWQSLGQPNPTNVSRLARCVAPQAEGIPQVVFYDDGVGVGEGVLNDVVKVVGGGLGKGLDAKIAQAYQFLCLNYAPGDRIFIFGFSRGAYTARSLTGLLRKCWILRRDRIGEINQAIALYRDRKIGVNDQATLDFKKANSQAVSSPANVSGAPDTRGSVRYVGVWDTVGSLGVPNTLPFASAFNDKYRFHDTDLSSFVERASHAVSIDERRNTFQPTLWSNLDKLNTDTGGADLPPEQRPYQQSWFPGTHGSVGGGDADDGLSLGPLCWIADGAARAGLVWDQAMLDTYTQGCNPAGRFAEQEGSIRNLLVGGGLSDRAPPPGFPSVSEYARARWRSVQAYRPRPLGGFSDQF
ncbi:MAG: DUF2235 domain-containing protein [Sphingomonadales bacterium]